MSVFVVVPSYNEAENIVRLVTELRRAQAEVNLILVDDGSPDGTASLARDLSEGDIEVIEREGKQGLASAYTVGFQRALERGAQRIVQMDADLSHDPKDVPRLVAGGGDLVLGSRYVAGGEREIGRFSVVRSLDLAPSGQGFGWGCPIGT